MVEKHVEWWRETENGGETCRTVAINGEWWRNMLNGARHGEWWRKMENGGESWRMVERDMA
jgi:hypothetical protein